MVLCGVVLILGPVALNATICSRSLLDLFDGDASSFIFIFMSCLVSCCPWPFMFYKLTYQLVLWWILFDSFIDVPLIN